MAHFRSVFTEGLRNALHHWRALLPLYLTSLLLGLAQTWPLLIAGDRALRNPFLSDLAGGGDALINLFLGNPAAGASAGVWVFVALFFTLLFGLAYNFFAGGILSVYAETRPFWQGCQQTFWTFTGLGLLLIVLALLAIVVAVALGGLIGSRGALITAVALTQLVNMAGEYARALAVTRDRRNPLALLGMALGFCGRNPGGALALALAGLLLHTALAAVYGAVASAIGGNVIAIVWQQIAVLGWLWVKLLRLAWAVSYTQVRDIQVGASPAETSSVSAAT
jgi:hypothetical protein